MPPTFVVTSVSVSGRPRRRLRANQRPTRATEWARRARWKSACASKTGFPLACAIAKPNISPDDRGKGGLGTSGKWSEFEVLTPYAVAFGLVQALSRGIGMGRLLPSPAGP